MRSKVTVVLLFLNVVLFFYIFKYDIPAINARNNHEARRRVLSPEIAVIDSLTRATATGETVRLERRGESWWLTQPYEWPADANAIARIVNELQLLEHEASFPVADLPKSGQSLADFGLAQPALILSFTSGGKSYPLRIGDNTTTTNRLYILSPDGTQIHVVNRSLAESVGLPLETLRAKNVFTVPVFEVRSLTVQTAAPSNLKVRLRRDVNAHWTFEAPINARASKSAAEVTINSLNALTTKNFLEAAAADLTRTGLNAPTLRVTLEGNARRETLLLGNPVNENPPPSADGQPAPIEYFAKFEDKAVVFSVAIPSTLLADLRSAQDKLRDAHVLDFEPRTITALTLTAPGQPELTLQRLDSPAASSWQLVMRVSGQAPQTSAADTAIVEEVIQKLHLLSANKFLSDAPDAALLENCGFNRPEREITLSLNTGGGPRGLDPSTQGLQIGLAQGEARVAFARATHAQPVYQIHPDVLEATPVHALYYRQRLVREIPEGSQIQSLTLIDLTTHETLCQAQLDATHTSWAQALASESETRRKATESALGQLRSLRAKTFTADTFNPDHASTTTGPSPWRYRLQVNYAAAAADPAAAPASYSLLLTERLGGNTQLAGTAETGGVEFEITQELLDAVFALTYAVKNDPGLPAEIPAPTPAPAPAP